MKKLSAALLIYLGLASAALAQTPTATNCGANPSVFGSNFIGQFIIGTGSTKCTITFSPSLNRAPTCTIATQNPPQVPTFTTTPAAINVTVGVASRPYSYLCTQG
jgi:hypothetical protein